MGFFVFWIYLVRSASWGMFKVRVYVAFSYVITTWSIGVRRCLTMYYRSLQECGATLDTILILLTQILRFR